MSQKRVGYAFWGYMADIRFRRGIPFSSPDSSLLYAFTILHAFQERGYETWRLFPDRDAEFVQFGKERCFKTFSQQKRWEAYSRAKQANHKIYDGKIESEWPDVDFVILEYRMPTKRNVLAIASEDFDPDLVLQERLIEYYTSKNVPIICLDLDYKLYDDSRFHFVFEPGFKRGNGHHFDFPFYMEDMLQFETEEAERKIVYVGNRYERDDEFEKFFGKKAKDVEFEVWGNWREGEKDSEVRWPHIHFKGRAQPYQIRGAYKNALAVPLLLKNEYNDYGFMTVRPIEALLFGTIPLLPTMFDSPIHYPFPRIVNEEAMIVVAEQFVEKKRRDSARKTYIDAMKFHDVENFIRKIESVI